VSKAFTKDDADDTPLLIPRRPPLPDGVPNYVTESGLAALRAELIELTQARAAIVAAPERLRETQVLAARIAELESRLASAELVPAAGQPRDEVRFGASVSVVLPNGAERHYRIVGVDEANAREGRVAFVAPIARALLGKSVGEEACVRTPHGEESLEVIAIRYD
jgi:transcription elongation factor GreB